MKTFNVYHSSKAAQEAAVGENKKWTDQLVEAVIMNDSQKVMVCLNHGANAAVQLVGDTLLNSAFGYRNEEVALMLLDDLHKRLSAEDFKNYLNQGHGLLPETVLNAAARSDMPRVVSALIWNYDADPGLVKYGKSPLHAACKYGSTATVKAFSDMVSLDFNVPEDTGMYKGFMPVDHLIARGRLDLVQMLLHKHNNVSLPLSHDPAKNRLSVIEALMSNYGISSHDKEIMLNFICDKCGVHYAELNPGREAHGTLVSVRRNNREDTMALVYDADSMKLTRTTNLDINDLEKMRIGDSVKIVRPMRDTARTQIDKYETLNLGRC